ncbi:MAG: hypothetical protein ACD_4C00041G0002 [uncultured bacterium (gcode 4)]|uniref:Uncharacterized protein n=1 Tax=uncultured bacterium (gcode 4) TaxID=1234023 RepID=K2GAF3_9BACT|nr:MAG: hypothetical protein ACD_4C00041G0002 [uncultured bacterium (gcode 4)]
MKKTSNNKIIPFILTIVIILWIFYLMNSPKFWGSKNSAETISQEQQDKEVKKFNEILNTVTKKEDSSNCDELEIQNLKDLCKAQIEDRFSIERSFTKVADCDKVWQKKWEPIEQSKDVCVHNVANRIAKNVKDSNLCESINSSSLRNLCKIQIEQKFLKN